MRRLLSIPLLLLLVGCTDIEALEKEVASTNVMTSSLKDEYKTSSESGYVNEKAFFSGDLGLISDDVNNFLDSQRSEVLSSIDYYYELAEMSELSEDNILELTLDSVTEVYYFLNTDKKVTEQMFIFDVPESFKRSIVLTYSGGEVVGYEEMVHD